MSGEAKFRGEIRPPAVAGRFYTANPADLAAQVRSFLYGEQKKHHTQENKDLPVQNNNGHGHTKAEHIQSSAEGARGQSKPPEPERQALGLLLPHAGYIFSGAVAGLTLRHLLDEPEPLPELFVLLGPNHTGRGVPLAAWPGGAWRTPLGDVPVDASFMAELTQSEELPNLAEQNPTPGGLSSARHTDAEPHAANLASPFKFNVSAHLGEHAIEVILPFLQVLAPKAAIAPICVADYNLDNLRLAGHLLAKAITRRDARFGQGGDKSRICIITSSDMNHFLPHEQNMRMDALALERLRALDPEGLFKVVLDNHISMCGFAPACLMLFACRKLGAKYCNITAHTSSGLTGKSFGADMNRVVGYAGAIID